MFYDRQLPLLTSLNVSHKHEYGSVQSVVDGSFTHEDVRAGGLCFLQVIFYIYSSLCTMTITDFKGSFTPELFGLF